MTKHLYGLVVTPYGVAANNRGENEGNITTLQKILWNGGIHTTVSAEAIRWALRFQWQKKGIPVNRRWDETKSDHSWQDSKWESWAGPEGEETFIDDDILGFMEAKAASTEGEAAETRREKEEERDALKAQLAKLSAKEKKSGKDKALRAKLSQVNAEVKQLGKGTAIKRRGALEVTRAISLTPFAGEITFNAKSGEKGTTSLYGTELHATRYQYGFALTPESLRRKERALDVVDAFVSLSGVGGNQSRFLYDFSPEAVVFRWTDDFAPRILYGFEPDGERGIAMPSVVKKVGTGDIDSSELVVGGPVVTGGGGGGPKVTPGVKAAAEEVKARIRSDLHL